MPEVRFRINDESYKELVRMAEEEGLSIQEFCRRRVFRDETIFTVAEFTKRAKEKYMDGETFTVADAYGQDWDLTKGPAGAFGKMIFNYLRDHKDAGIEFAGMDKGTRRASYVIKEK